MFALSTFIAFINTRTLHGKQFQLLSPLRTNSFSPSPPRYRKFIYRPLSFPPIILPPPPRPRTVVTVHYSEYSVVCTVQCSVH